MKRQYMVIGLGTFGCAMVEELLQLSVEVLIMDTLKDRINLWKDRVDGAWNLDALDFALVDSLVPPGVKDIIIDLEDRREASILLTHNFSKSGRRVMVRAESRDQGEILSLLGAHKVVYPDKEAAKRLVPSLVNEDLLSFIPMGKNLVFAEILVPASLVGKSVVESSFRQSFDLTVLAVRNSTIPGRDSPEQTEESDLSQGPAIPMDAEYRSIFGQYRFEPRTVMLVSGTREALDNYTRRFLAGGDKAKGGLESLGRILRFGREKKH